MSNSLKVGIIKDRPRRYKKSSWYWRIVRRVQRQAVKRGKEPKKAQEIVNDYEYSDYEVHTTYKKVERK
jgi:hypothetical protein